VRLGHDASMFNQVLSNLVWCLVEGQQGLSLGSISSNDRNIALTKLSLPPGVMYFKTTLGPSEGRVVALSN